MTNFSQQPELLRQEQGPSSRIAATYPFNGVGVGDLKADGSMSYIIEQFDRQRTKSGGEIVPSDSHAGNSRNQVYSRLSGSASQIDADVMSAHELPMNVALESEEALAC